MAEKEAISLHKTERLAAALRYCELRREKEAGKKREGYAGIWHAIYVNGK